MEMKYALVKKAMRGNPKAFGTLIEARQETMYRIAFLYVRNEADALDVVQESILKAYKNIKSLREPKAFHSWLMRIVTNTAHDLLRQRGKQVPMEENILSSTSKTRPLKTAASIPRTRSGMLGTWWCETAWSRESIWPGTVRMLPLKIAKSSVPSLCVTAKNSNL